MIRKLLIGCLLAATPVTLAASADGTACAEGTQSEPASIVAGCDALLAAAATAEVRIADILMVRANALVRQGRQRLAIVDLNRAIELRPDHPEPLLRRALLQQSVGETAAAIDDYGRIIRLRPGDIAALLARAELYRAKADRRRALADYAAVLRLDPAHATASVQHKALAQEIERQGAMMPLQGAPR